MPHLQLNLTKDSTYFVLFVPQNLGPCASNECRALAPFVFSVILCCKPANGKAEMLDGQYKKGHILVRMSVTTTGMRKLDTQRSFINTTGRLRVNISSFNT